MKEVVVSDFSEDLDLLEEQVNSHWEESQRVAIRDSEKATMLMHYVNYPMPKGRGL